MRLMYLILCLAYVTLFESFIIFTPEMTYTDFFFDTKRSRKILTRAKHWHLIFISFARCVSRDTDFGKLSRRTLVSEKLAFLYIFAFYVQSGHIVINKQ